MGLVDGVGSMPGGHVDLETRHHRGGEGALLDENAFRRRGAGRADGVDHGLAVVDEHALVEGEFADRSGDVSVLVELEVDPTGLDRLHRGSGVIGDGARLRIRTPTDPGPSAGREPRG